MAGRSNRTIEDGGVFAMGQLLPASPISPEAAKFGGVGHTIATMEAVMDKSPDWSEAWAGVANFVPLGDNNMFTGFLDLYVPKIETEERRTAIEIGCFPG